MSPLSEQRIINDLYRSFLYKYFFGISVFNIMKFGDRELKYIYRVIYKQFLITSKKLSRPNNGIGSFHLSTFKSIGSIL